MPEKTEPASSTLGLSRSEKFEIVLVYLPIVVATVIGFVAATIIGNTSVSWPAWELWHTFLVCGMALMLTTLPR